MSIRIPLNLQPRVVSSATSSRPGIRLNLPLRLVSFLGTATTAEQEREAQVPSSPDQGRDAQVLRAVAAAASLSTPRRALELAQEARDNPENVIAPTLTDEQKRGLNSMLLAVTRVQDDRSGAPIPNAAHQAVARAVGVDPVLVAAAHAEIERDDTVADPGLQWVASVNGELLDHAARAGAREKQLGLVPSQLSRLDRLENDMADVKENVTQLDDRVQKLENAARGAKGSEPR